MPKLFFTGDIGNIQCLQAREMRPSVRYLIRKEKKRFGEGFEAVIGI